MNFKNIIIFIMVERFINKFEHIHLLIKNYGGKHE